MAESVPQSESKSLQLTSGSVQAVGSMLDLDTRWCRESESVHAEAHVMNRSRASFNRMGPIPRSFSGGRIKSPSHCSHFSEENNTSRPFLLYPFSLVSILFFFQFFLALYI